MRFLVISLRVLGCAAGATAALGQPSPLSIQEAVDDAIHNYPAVHVSQEQIGAAAAGIQLARTSYLPKVDVLAQANRATRNNIFGLLLPQSVIPSISGPVLGTNNFGTAFGSAVGVLVSWEPFDFGLRRANVARAAAARTEAEATLERTRYDVAVQTAEAYLTLAAAGETVRAAEAGVERAEVILKTIRALVNSGLRPGADGSRAEAELAAARTQWIGARQAVELARVTLAQYTGKQPEQIVTGARKFLELPPDNPEASVDSAANPAERQQAAVIERAEADIRALERSYFPRFYLQGSAYARGTGAETNGGLLGGVNGLAPSVQNYALGFSMTFPVMDLPAIRARESGQAATVRAEKARYQQIEVELRARMNAARVRLKGAREIAANTPVEVNAARAAVQQSTARYQSGLSNIDELAEAQRLLTQAEIDDALARLSVWRGLLEIAAVAGDIRPFLAEASQ